MYIYNKLQYLLCYYVYKTIKILFIYNITLYMRINNFTANLKQEKRTDNPMPTLIK